MPWPPSRSRETATKWPLSGHTEYARWKLMNENTNISGKIVVITGANSGLGEVTRRGEKLSSVYSLAQSFLSAVLL